MTNHDVFSTSGRETVNCPAAPSESISSSVLGESLGFALRKAYQYANIEATNVLASFDLRPQDFAVMDIIGANPGHTQTAISAVYGIQKTNFVGLITNLEHRHLVERRKVVGNRRVFALHLTSTGEKMLRKVEAAHCLHEERMQARLGETRSRQLLELLHDFTNA